MDSGAVDDWNLARQTSPEGMACSVVGEGVGDNVGACLDFLFVAHASGLDCTFSFLDAISDATVCCLCALAVIVSGGLAYAPCFGWNAAFLRYGGGHRLGLRVDKHLWAIRIGVDG